jgi:hypothetical protein
MPVRRGATSYSNEEVAFALLVNQTKDFDNEEVEPRTTKNIRNCVRYALREALKTEDDHTLHILVNDRNWLSDPLEHIQEAVEAEKGTIKDFNLVSRRFTVQTKDEFQLDIFIHGGAEEPKEESDTEEVAAPAAPEVVEILDTTNESEVVEILDSSAEVIDFIHADHDSESESDYEDFTEKGLTQLVNQVVGAPFKLPPF